MTSPLTGILQLLISSHTFRNTCSLVPLFPCAFAIVCQPCTFCQRPHQGAGDSLSFTVENRCSCLRRSQIYLWVECGAIIMIKNMTRYIYTVRMQVEISIKKSTKQGHAMVHIKTVFQSVQQLFQREAFIFKVFLFIYFKKTIILNVSGVWSITIYL